MPANDPEAAVMPIYICMRSARHNAPLLVTGNRGYATSLDSTFNCMAEGKASSLPNALMRVNS